MRHIAHIPLQPYLASLPGRVSLTEGLREDSAKLADLQDSIKVTDLDGKPVEPKPPKERKTAEQFMRDLTEHGSQESWIVSGVLGEKTLDLSRLREPIHKIFANWASSPSDIAVFTRKYGLLEDWLIGETSISDEHLIGEEWLPYDFEFYVSDWIELQEDLRNWWRYRFGPVPEEADPRRKALLAEAQKVKAERRREKGESGPQPPPTYFERAAAVAQEISLAVSEGWKGTVAELVAPDLWHYIVVLLLSERQGMLRICRRKDCLTPYYVATRKDQKYCGTDCSQAVATRRWWALHGKEWRKKRKHKGKRKKKKRR